MPSSLGSAFGPLGAPGDPGRRFWFHHMPLAVGSTVLLAMFMTFPIFDISAYGHADIVTGTIPRHESESERADAREGHTGPIAARQDHGHRMAHGAAEPQRHGGGHRTEGPDGPAGVPQQGHTIEGVRMHRVDDTSGDRASAASSRSIQQLTVATGSLAVVLLAVTLLLGPANLLLRRRNPVSSYLRRDVGIWAAVFSAIHVAAAVMIHVSHGSGLAATVLHFFINENGRVLTNSFGVGNWAGLAALVIALGLLAISSDAALRRMKARPWKWVQRLAYALFGLVVLHALFYGALLRMTSPFTLLLILSVATVLVGQLAGMWLWRRRYRGDARPA